MKLSVKKLFEEHFHKITKKYILKALLIYLFGDIDLLYFTKTSVDKQVQRERMKEKVEKDRKKSSFLNLIKKNTLKQVKVQSLILEINWERLNWMKTIQQ